MARTKAARHKASATAGATVFRMSGSTRLVVVLASLKYKPLALPIASMATRSPGWVQGLHKSFLRILLEIASQPMLNPVQTILTQGNLLGVLFNRGTWKVLDS